MLALTLGYEDITNAYEKATCFVVVVKVMRKTHRWVSQRQDPLSS